MSKPASPPRTAPPVAACVDGGRRWGLENPWSSACHDNVHAGCDGFTDGYSTYHCGCPHHWCPSGEHLRKHCPNGEASNGG